MIGVLKAWIELIYPPRCPACGSLTAPSQDGEGMGLCPVCLPRLKPLRAPFCMRCGVPLEGGSREARLCGSCLMRPPPFETSRSCFLYEGAALEIIHRFKYNGLAHLVETLGPPLMELAREALPSGLEAVVTPVPLHPRKLRQRGFNQSLLLARYVARLPGLTLDPFCLRRLRDTPRQVDLGREERRRNVRNAFEVPDPRRIKDREVLLVDDVSTTGSTLESCSRALLAAGASRVYCLSSARAV
ncbi:MAG: double zinc ribbon domain-containing protein [Desulfobacteraceae bacterium]